LSIKDPPLYYDIGACLNITSFVNPFIASAIINDEIFQCCTDASATNCEEPQRSCAVITDCTQAPYNTCAGDGIMDLSIVAVFRPLAQAQAGGNFELNFADCTAPLVSTSCTGGDTVQPATYSNVNSGTCLTPVPGTTTSGQGTTVLTPSAPCFVSDELSITFDFSGIQIPLSAVRGAATYEGGTPATALSAATDNGLLYGFLLESVADQILLPELAGFVPEGTPLSQMLPGGTGNCKTATPRGPCTTGCLDTRDNGPGGLGWYFYINFGAPKVPFSDPAP
jgi:hypothetical protein